MGTRLAASLLKKGQNSLMEGAGSQEIGIQEPKSLMEVEEGGPSQETGFRKPESPAIGGWSQEIGIQQQLETLIEEADPGPETGFQQPESPMSGGWSQEIGIQQLESHMVGSWR